jgi:hypothetical protein
MPGIYLWTALQLHKTFSRKEDRMAEMNDRSSVKPETSPFTRAQLAIADVAGVALTQAWHVELKYVCLSDVPAYCNHTFEKEH